jgi:hypothetical protein
LTDEAAQFLSDPLETRLQGGIFELAVGIERTAGP